MLIDLTSSVIITVARMNVMKSFKMLLSLSIALLVSTGLFAQASSDPLDYFYDDLVVWETMGPR